MENASNLGESLTLFSPLKLQEGVASLSRGTYFKEASLDMTLSILTESAAQTSGVDRVSIWALTHAQKELRCLDLFERQSGRHSRGTTLTASRYPAYFQALGTQSAIVADEPLVHPAMLELAEGYLVTHRISALLHAPIHIRGELQGVLCLEQVRTQQPWTTEHRLFSQAVANLVTLALVEYEADEARRQAESADLRLRAVFDASRDALLLADGENGVILDANRQAEKLFACARQDLIGKHQRQLHPRSVEKINRTNFGRVVSGDLLEPVITEIQRFDGTTRSVEIISEVADVGDGRSLALGIFRPI